MVKILIDGTSILRIGRESASFVRNGYIYIENGIIKSLGQSPAPEEYLYPELLIGGHGRLTTRGFASGFTVLSLYPIRYELDDIDWLLMREVLKAIRREDAYYVFVLPLAELASKGVTEALVVDAYLDEAARASRDVGIDVTLAPPLNCGFDDQQQLHELKLLLGRWHNKVEGVKVGIAVCRELKEKYVSIAREAGIPLYVVELEKNVESPPKDVKVVAINPLSDVSLPRIYCGKMIREWRDGAGLGIGVRPSYSMRDVLRELLWTLSFDPVSAMVAGTRVTSEIIGHGESSTLAEGSKSNIVVYDLSEPPGWPIPRDLHSAARAIIAGEPPVETVVVGDDIILDREGLLTVGHEVFRKAAKKIEDIYSTPPLPLLSRRRQLE